MDVGATRTHPRALAVAVAAALAAALAGGVVWALIVRATDYEVGLVAWAIGWLAGSAALAAGRGTRGHRLQAAAVLAALAGILLGKYLSFAWTVQEVAEEMGASIGLFSHDARALFRESLGDVFGWMDILFAGLAVYTAWRIPARPQLPPPRPAGNHRVAQTGRHPPPGGG